MGWIIPKATAADTESIVFSRGSLPKTVVLVGDIGSDTIAINFLNEDASTTAAYDSAGNALVLSATKPSLGIYAPCNLQFVKGITANQVGVQLVD